MLLAGIAQAQQATPVAVPDPTPVPPADAPAATTAPVSTTPQQDNVTTLGEVRALKPEDEPLDLYRFKNPVKFGDNRFSRDWSEPPSPEQVSMGGGYIMMGVVKGVLAAGRGLNKLTGDRTRSRPRPHGHRRNSARNSGSVRCGSPSSRMPVMHRR